MGLLDAADVNFLRFEELLKFKFLLSHPFCIPMHDAKWLVTVSCTLPPPHPPSPRPLEEDQSCSQSHWLGPFEAEGSTPSHPGCGPPGRHHNYPKIIARPCYCWYGDNRFSTRAKVAVSSDFGGWGFYSEWLLPKDSCFTELAGPSYPGLYSAFPSHRRFVFQDLRAPSALTTMTRSRVFPSSTFTTVGSCKFSSFTWSAVGVGLFNI